MSVAIFNASSLPIDTNTGTLPNVQGALLNWFRPLTFTQITKSVVNFRLVEAQTQISFQGVKQPMSPQQLALKPEGQRRWIWTTIHAFPDVPLGPDDIIVIDSQNFRVMEKLDYSPEGYVELHLAQDYQ